MAIAGEVHMTTGKKAIRLEQAELQEIKSIYEGVMNLAANGLFFRAGQVIGRGVAKRASAKGGPYLKAVAELLVEEGWAQTVEVSDEQVAVVGGIEVRNGVDRSCNMLRGVIAEVFSKHTGSKLFCHEVECQGSGAQKCVFKIRKGVV
jgi:predicted hydrocarbon binding protein